MLDFFNAHRQFLFILAGASVITFIGTLIAIPYIIISLPSNYFTGRHRTSLKKQTRHPVVSLVAVLTKNITGVVFITAGFIMLFIPGQGLLTILIGLLLTNFPGKYYLQRRLIANGTVFNAINMIRKRAGKDAIEKPELHSY